MIKTKLIRISLISLLISITFTLVLFDAIMPYESVAKGENIQYEQKIQWTQTYGGTGSDRVSTLLQTVDGGFTLAGLTNSFGSGDFDMWLVKTDANGVLQWNQTYGGANIDWANALLQTTDGGFALAGSTQSFSDENDFDMWLVKTDANGVLQWNQTYGGTDDDMAWALLRTTADGGFALAGSTTSFGTGGDMWLVKTDANGVMQWNQTYGGAESDGASTLIQTTDGGFALAGLTNSFGSGDFDMWLVKTDVNGVVQWTRTYGGIGLDWASTLLQTMDGDFALAGITRSFGGGNDSDMWLVKTNANGVVQWNQTYGGAESDGASTLIQTTDGGFALAGLTNSFGSGDFDMWLVKTDANGVVQWEQTFGGAESDEAFALLQTVDGDFALAGDTKSYGAGSDDIWVIKTMPTSALEKLLAYFLNSTIFGVIIIVVALIALILVIKKQKRGS